MKKEGKNVNRTKIFSLLIFIMSIVMILLVSSLLVYGDGFSSATNKASHTLLYTDTITSKTEGGKIMLSTIGGLEVTTGNILLGTVTGNVGIGTTNPGVNRLQVQAANGLWTAVNGDGSITVNRDGSAPYISFQGSGSGSSQLYNPVEGTGRAMTFSTTADGGGSLSEKVRITGAGNVGIGTAGPGAKLHIQGLSVGNSNIRLTNTFMPRSWELNPYTVGVNDGSFAIRDATAGKDRIAIDGSGNIGIGTQGPLNKLEISDGILRISDSGVVTTSKFDSQGAATGGGSSDNSIILNGDSPDRPEISWYRGNRQYPEFSIREHTTADTGATFWVGNGQAAPSAAVSIINSGNVGVGTTSPGSLLEIGSSNTEKLRFTGANENRVRFYNGAARFMLADTAANSFQIIGNDGTDFNVAEFSNAKPSNIKFWGKLSVGTSPATPDSTIEISGADAAITLDQDTSTPTNPSAGNKARIYMKGDKLIVQYNDGGTTRYKYLTLSGTGNTWIHTTTAP